MKAVVLFLVGFVLGACGEVYRPPVEPVTGGALAFDLAAKTVALARYREEGAKAYCSGVWVSERSILTAAHCVEGDPTPGPETPYQQDVHYAVEADVIDPVGRAARERVVLRGGVVVEVDGAHDLALVRAKPPLPPHRVAQVGLESIVQGAKAFTMGHPLGLWWSFSSGEIAAIRKIDLEPDTIYVQTTAPTSRGNSGCGLFDEQGKLMGIAHAGMPSGSNLAFYVHAQYADALIRKWGDRL